ncbi:Hypothetical_protein [Hexamita inflata]|uniref:Hypothetical_protein n=1 Tax=Hexamita inflata TaxID=28002 RepID=A0AA86RF22_9EUKA|nr:Hypothetical protein HINF_LOCUS62922 [Hexamita inflata]
MKIDANNSGSILYSEFLLYALDKNLDDYHFVRQQLILLQQFNFYNLIYHYLRRNSIEYLDTLFVVFSSGFKAVVTAIHSLSDFFNSGTVVAESCHIVTIPPVASGLPWIVGSNVVPSFHHILVTNAVCERLIVGSASHLDETSTFELWAVTRIYITQIFSAFIFPPIGYFCSISTQIRFMSTLTDKVSN